MSLGFQLRLGTVAFGSSIPKMIRRRAIAILSIRNLVVCSSDASPWRTSGDSHLRTAQPRTGARGSAAEKVTQKASLKNRSVPGLDIIFVSVKHACFYQSDHGPKFAPKEACDGFRTVTKTSLVYCLRNIFTLEAKGGILLKECHSLPLLPWRLATRTDGNCRC